MNPILRNVIAVVVGWLGGSFVNINLINIGNSKYPIEGMDPKNMEALAEVMSSLSPEHFVFPFLEHAFGTLVGATIAALIAKENKKRSALIVGGIFLLGGIAVNIMLPGPLWFSAVDIIVAYLPMALLGLKIGEMISGSR